MEIVEIAQTETTPEVKFDLKNGQSLIKGKWTGNNASEFYKPIIEAIRQYSQQPVKKTVIDIYFEGCTHNYFFSILKEFETIRNSEIVCNWYFFEDDENVLGVGEDYASMLNYRVNFIEIKE